MNPPDSGSVFDSHLHIVDPRFPVVANAGYVPDTFTVDDYRRRVADLGVTGGAVVAGSFQGTDRAWILDALDRLGPGFVGVVNADPTLDEAVIRALHDAGVRAVRANLVRGGAAALDGLEALANRVFELAGWHVELYVDSRDLAELFAWLAGLPRISIDHLGLSARGLPRLLRLVERGARVKATGFGRVDLDVPAALADIHRVDPDALMAGTDLPSTRAPRPFADGDLDLVAEALGADADRVLRRNAVAWYAP